MHITLFDALLMLLQEFKKSGLLRDLDIDTSSGLSLADQVPIRAVTALATHHCLARYPSPPRLPPAPHTHL